MKLVGVLLLTFLLFFAPQVHAQVVTYSGNKIPLKEIFSVIKNQTGIFFFYDAALLQDSKPVTVQWSKVSLETALNECFQHQQLTWVLEDKTVTVIRKQATPSKVIIEPTQKQSSVVTGQITDAEGNAIPGASVVIKGTQRGTKSGETGEFSVTALPNDVLVVSSVNYYRKEVRADQKVMNVQLERDIKPMELLLVGGNINAIKRKADATSITVLDSKTLEKIPVNTLDQVFRGWVPGANSFNVGDEPEGFPSLSLRGAGGATSLSHVAIYIDGIEYAGGSGYLCQLDKTNIDRIEIVRGPGAATMYGTGSNGGIVQIFTKRGRADQTSVNFTSSAGFYKTKWVKNDPFQQLHNLETTTSFKNVLIKLGGSYRTVGAYLPDGGDKNKGFYGGVSFNIGKLQANLWSRYNVRDNSLSREPYFDTAIHPRTDIIIEPEPGRKVPAYVWLNVKPTNSLNKDAITESSMTGINLSHKTSENWINKIDAGYTTNGNNEVPKNDGVTPPPRQYISTENTAITIRYSNVLTLESPNHTFAAVISNGAEYKRYSYLQTFTRPAAGTSLRFADPANENYGAFVQLNPSYKNIYLTLGMRYEKNTRFEAAWNPRLGLTTNFDTRSLTIKPRISWGRGITSPEYEHRFGRPVDGVTVVYANPDIKPQTQQGVDLGMEIYDQKGRFKFEVVHYNNIMKDMFGQLQLAPTPRDSNLPAFLYTNVCKVANTGWEFSGEYRVKRFNVQGSFSIMNSVIRDSTGSYILPQLQLPPGSRMVNLPRHTAGLNITYNVLKVFGISDKASISLNVTEMDGIRTLDIIGYRLDVAYGRAPYDPNGMQNRFSSPQLFRLGLYGEHFISKHLKYFVQAFNILNDYKYEYMSNNPTHGATWLFGFKYHYSKNMK